METTVRHSPPALLVAGDAIVLLLVTWIGFARHGESLLTPRWLLTYLPLLVAWAFASPWFGAYADRLCGAAAGIWRSALAMLLAVPLAAFLRSLLLGEDGADVVFTAVLMAVSTVAIVIWRSIWWWICKRNGENGRS